MVRLGRWQLVVAVAVALMSLSGIQAQDVGIMTAGNPETAVVTDTTAPVATEAAVPIATSASPIATEAATILPAASEVATIPVATEAVTLVPISSATETVIETAATPVPVSTHVSTISTPAVAPSTTEVASDPSATMPVTPPSNLRGSDDESSRTNASSSTSSSKSASESTTGTLDGSSSTKTAVMCLLGGVGSTIIMSLLFVVWRNRRRQDSGLRTPIPRDTDTITFPDMSMPSVVPPSAPWKASGPTFASRDLPLTENTRAKMNATTRSSTEYDLANRPSQIASLSAHSTSAQTLQTNRETNASSEQSFSIRGYSEFSVQHADDSVMTNERDSTNDRYDGYGRYSTSSRLSSEAGRSNSGWFQRQTPTSSNASSLVATKHNPVSFLNHELTQTPNRETPVNADSTTSRTDIPDWYNVIESPTDNDRYTTSSLDSDNISNERESYEL